MGVNPNDIIECEVQVLDVRGGTATSKDQIVIENRNPEADSIEIQVAGRWLLCNASFSDPDNDSFDVTYEWKRIEPVEEVFEQSSAFLDLSLLSINGGDIIKCYSTATDNWGGFSSQSTTIEIGDQDDDLDGLTDEEEEEYATDPNNPDSDGDGCWMVRKFINMKHNQTTQIVMGMACWMVKIFCVIHIFQMLMKMNSDWKEGTSDLDGDGIINCLDDDSDGDGHVDAFETGEDIDQDGLINPLDTDRITWISDFEEGNVNSDEDELIDLWMKTLIMTGFQILKKEHKI